MTESMREAFEEFARNRFGVLCDTNMIDGMYCSDLMQFGWLSYQAASTQPQQWIKCSDREPSDMDADWRGHVYAFSEGIVSMKHWMDVVGAGYSHWMPTNLNRPEPPKE